MPKFDRYESSYRCEVEHAIGFSGQPLEFFTAVKAAEMLRAVERHVGDASQLTALDVGCGAGETDRELVGSFARLHGVDVSPGMIEAATTANPTVRYQLYDGETLPFDDEAFDVVFAISVLHHVPPLSWGGLVSELRRVARRSGLVVVIEHNPHNPMTRLAVARCTFDRDATLLRRGRVKRLFTQCGLRTCESRYIMFFPWRAVLLRRIEVRLGRIPAGAQYLVAGRPQAVSRR